MAKRSGRLIAIYNASPFSPPLQDGAETGLFVDDQGNLKVNIVAGGGGGDTATATNQTNGAQKTQLVDPTGTNLDNGAGALNVVEVVPSVVNNNIKLVTTAGTRVALQSATTNGGIVIKALKTNTGTIYVGGSTVSSANGFQLAAGDTVAFAINDASNVSIDASVNGEGVSWLGTT